MPTAPAVTSNNPALEAAVSSWFTASRMPLPPGFGIRLAVVDFLGTWDDPRELYTQGDVEIRAGEPLGWVHLTWRGARARARIDEHRPEAVVEVSPRVLQELDAFLRTFLLVTVIFLLKRAGHYHLHAGTAIDPAGRGWMLVGDSRSGKSTTTALLAARGWQVGTDDIAFLTRRQERAAVVAFRSPIALRQGGFDLVGKAGGIDLESRDKTGFWPEDLGAKWVQTVDPAIIVFTSVGGERTTLVPMKPADVIAQLLQWSVWVLFEPTAAQEHLDLLSQLGRQARCYRATLAPDLFAAPGALGDFLP